MAIIYIPVECLGTGCINCPEFKIMIETNTEIVRSDDGPITKYSNNFNCEHTGRCKAIEQSMSDRKRIENKQRKGACEI